MSDSIDAIIIIQSMIILYLLAYWLSGWIIGSWSILFTALAL